MKSNLKYSITGTVLATLLIVAAISVQYGNYQAEGLIGAQSSTELGLEDERARMGLSTGYDDRLYVVHITSGNPDSQHERHSAMMGIQHAKAFQDAGKNVIVFLDVDGVRIADEDRPVALTVQHAALKEFLNGGGRVIACEHCVASFDVNNLVRGVEIDPHPYMPKIQKILSEVDVVLDY
ncbi:MAG: hypothetical protein ACW9W3_06550 [Candidatus Nitrosopumilus sp. bin_68KS]